LKNLTGLLRLLRAVGQLFAGILTIARHFGAATQLQKEEHIAQWARAVLHAMGITVQSFGVAARNGPLLVIANHISWLDILVMLAVQPVRFVSKSDVKRWPLIGWLATQAGTLYIERDSRRDALRVVHHIAQALRDGQMIAVFPEGTTSDGYTLLPFHANLIQAAISAHTPVQAVAIDFRDVATGQRSTTPAYVDDDSLLTSIWRTVVSPPIVAHLRFAPPQASEGRERRAWAAALRDEVLQLRDNPTI
jgi:1-acyl-sn-glycerol-3-phosphate acyltransferase